jgi:sialate O-acetylesterase
LPIAVKGAIWYQGEHNAGGPDGYADKLSGLITGWRKDFKQGDFSFYIVQLPNFCDPNPDPAGGDGWARIREEQFNVTKTTVNTGIAVIMDTGLVDNAHPDDKVTVGHRLAQWAFAKDYGKKDHVYSGPLFKELKVEGNKAIVSFDSTGTGLMVGKKENMKLAQEVKDTAPGGFAIAGADKVWHWAEAKIDGHKITLTCDKVSTPIAVRYGFSGNPVKCNLYNKEGLPTAQFRTDNWDIPVETVQDLRGWKARKAEKNKARNKAVWKKPAKDNKADDKGPKQASTD